MAIGTSAHNFKAPEAVAVANVLVGERLALTRTMSRSFESLFGGGKGAVINVRVPAVLMARRRNLHSTDPILLDTIKQGTTFPLALSDHIYHAVRLDDADLTLDLTDFGAQVLSPQAIAVGEDVERVALAVLKSVALTALTTLPYDATKPEATFTKARKMLRDKGLPTEGFFAAVGTAVYANLLDSNALKDASQAGDAGALRNADTGRVRGFDIVESNALDTDEIIFYSNSSFHLAVRAPVVPAGVAFGASASGSGFALRWIRDYDSVTLADRSVVSTFVGGGVVPVYRQVDVAAVAANPSATPPVVAADARVDLVQEIPAIRIKTGVV